MSKKFCKASIPMIKVGMHKLNLVAGLIRGMDANEALLQLQFCKKRIAKIVEVLLASCMANAKNNHGMSSSNLKVDSVLVGKGFTMKRMLPRAKGRGDRINKHFSCLTIILTDESNSA